MKHPWTFPLAVTQQSALRVPVMTVMQTLSIPQMDRRPSWEDTAPKSLLGWSCVARGVNETSRRDAPSLAQGIGLLSANQQSRREAQDGRQGIQASSSDSSCLRHSTGDPTNIGGESTDALF